MNKNFQRETNLHQPVSRTATSHWVSASQSHHCSSTLTRQWRSAMSTHTLSVCLSVPLLPTRGVQATHPIPGKEHEFLTAIQPPTSIGGHKPWLSTTFCPLGRWLSLPSREGTNAQLVWTGCGNLFGRLSGKKNQEKITRHLLHRCWCQPIGKGLECLEADGKNITTKTPKYNIQAHIKNFKLYSRFFFYQWKIRLKYNGKKRMFLKL